MLRIAERRLAQATAFAVKYHLVVYFSAAGFPASVISKAQYVALSGFRSRLAQFLRFSEHAAHDAGLQPVQYLLLLHLRGFAKRDWATIGELAARLCASHQGTVALVKRCERNGLITKRRSLADARRVEIHLTAKARALLERVAGVHKNELRRLGGVLRATNFTAAK